MFLFLSKTSIFQLSPVILLPLIGLVYFRYHREQDIDANIDQSCVQKLIACVILYLVHGKISEQKHKVA
jgi:hypothetical protein